MCVCVCSIVSFEASYFLFLFIYFLENIMREVRLKYMVRLNINSRANWRTPFRGHISTKCTSKYFLVYTTKYGAILLSGNVFDCHPHTLFLSIMSGVAILRSCIKPQKCQDFRVLSFCPLAPGQLHDSTFTQAVSFLLHPRKLSFVITLQHFIRQSSNNGKRTTI